MSKELLPCPFCGGDDIKIIGTYTQKQAECQHCGAKTNHMMKDASAIEAWNTRASGWISVDEIKKFLDEFKEYEPVLKGYINYSGDKHWIHLVLEGLIETGKFRPEPPAK